MLTLRLNARGQTQLKKRISRGPKVTRPRKGGPGGRIPGSGGDPGDPRQSFQDGAPFGPDGAKGRHRRVAGPKKALEDRMQGGQAPGGTEGGGVGGF